MTEPELSLAHGLIVTKAAAGEVVDFSVAGDPDELPAYDDESFWSGRTIDGAWLAGFLTATDSSVHRRGVTIIGARILGGLDLECAELERRLILRRGQLGPHVVNLDEARTRTICLRGCQCGGLTADSIQIAGSLQLDHGFGATGEVRLLGATITGTLECRGGSFTNPAGDALSFDRAKIGGSVFLDDGFVATGGVRFIGASIGGALECGGGIFTTVAGDALSFDGATIGRGVFLDNTFVATGEVRLKGATTGGDLDCSGGSFTAPGGRALDASGAKITGLIRLRDGFRAAGLVSLRGASAGSLVDKRDSWPERFDLDGFRYARLDSPDLGSQDRADWLARQSRPRPGPYLQLAEVYRATGGDGAARKILMARHNALLRPPEHWKEHLPSGLGGRLNRAWRWVLRLTIGHGYEPWRVLWLVVPLVAAMTLWYADARRHDVLAPVGTNTATASRCTDEHPCVQPFVYAVDNLVPLVDFGQRSKWVPDQSRHGDTPFRDGRWLAAATWVTSTLGWAFALLVAAAFSQVVRRE